MSEFALGDRVRYFQRLTGTVADPEDPATRQSVPGFAPVDRIWVWYDEPVPGSKIWDAASDRYEQTETAFGSWFDPGTLERL